MAFVSLFENVSELLRFVASCFFYLLVLFGWS